MQSKVSEAPIRYRYYDFIMVAFVVILLLSNLIGAGKVADIGGFEFGAAILFFPLSYVIGDVLTEVYGYARARRVVWVGFAAMLFTVIMVWLVGSMPPADRWTGQEAYDAVFSQTPRIVLASVVAFWGGEFANAVVMARMKVWTEGKYLWTRTIGSTVVGQGIDSAIFYPVAFYGVWSNDLLVTVLISNWAMKTGWEALLTPVTYRVVNWLKRAEGADVYDRDMDFTPFKVKLER